MYWWINGGKETLEMRYRRRDRGEKKREIEERQSEIQREKIKEKKQRREIDEILREI